MVPAGQGVVSHIKQHSLLLVESEFLAVEDGHFFSCTWRAWQLPGKSVRSDSRPATCM